MSSMDLSSIDFRYQKAYEALKLEKIDPLEDLLRENGIERNEEGLSYLDSDIVSMEVLGDLLKDKFPGKGLFIIKAAASYLKGIDPFVKKEKEKVEEIRKPESSTDALVEYLKENKPVQQMSDRNLLKVWIEKREDDMERELNKRAKGQPFIILKREKTEPGKETVDFEFSLEMLKASKKGTNPTIVPYKNNTFTTVYRITELNINDRLIEYCPFCGETMWKSYCASCESNLSGVGDDERSFIRLIVNADKINEKSISDRRSVIVCALKGVEELKEAWPSIRISFEEKKLLGELPILKKLANRPPSIKVDPFNTLGNRTY